jgi:hypothetical protein
MNSHSFELLLGLALLLAFGLTCGCEKPAAAMTGHSQMHVIADSLHQSFSCQGRINRQLC